MNLKWVAMGDLLRAEKATGSELGVKLGEIMAAGELVPDDIVITLLEKAMDSGDKSGLLLDGYPRTVEQAEKLAAMMDTKGCQLDSILEFQVDEQKLAERITGRRVHPASGRSYHVVFNPPKEEGKDDITGEDLVQREDDTEEALKSRMVSYNKMTVPILAYYEKKGAYKKVLNASASIKDVEAQVDAITKRFK